VEQTRVDQQNADFWSELCGTGMARALGISGESPDALQRFDDAYFGFYPYLAGYVDRFEVSGRAVLEIGLGYGTLGQYIAVQGARYHGLDIAPTPVEMMRHRLRLLGRAADEDVVQGSALDIPWPDATFDYVYSIGCLHHTGGLQRAIEEVRRVLTPEGVAVVMLYNRYSARQLWRVDLARVRGLIGRRVGRSAEAVRAEYDSNAAGEAAPHTDFTSRRAVRRLFSSFSHVDIDARNFDDVYRNGKLLVSRARLLRTPIPKLFGLDLYITARK